MEKSERKRVYQQRMNNFFHTGKMNTESPHHQMNLQEIIGTLTKRELKESIPPDTIPSRCYTSWRELSAAVLHLSDEAKDLIRGASLAKSAAAIMRTNANSRLKRKRDNQARQTECDAHRNEGKAIFDWTRGKKLIHFGHRFQ